MSIKKKNKLWKWNYLSEEILIESLERHPCLYKVTDKDYHNRNKRDISIEVITESVKDVLPYVTKEAVKYKLQYLRKQFRNELIIAKQKKSGDDSNDVYESDWWCFNKLLFLVEHVKPRSSISNVNIKGSGKGIICDSNCASGVEDDVESMDVNTDANEFLDVNEASGESTPVNSNQMKMPFTSMMHIKRSKAIQDREILRKTTKFMETLTALASKEEDPIDTFCKFISNELKTIRSKSLLIEVKRHITTYVLDVIDQDTACIAAHAEYSSTDKPN